MSASYPYPPQPAQRNSLALLLGPLVLLLLMVAFVVWWFWPVSGSGLNPNVKPRPVVDRGPLDAEEQATIELYKEARPSVVHVTRLAAVRDYLNLNVQRIPEGTGSGFVWDEDGHIVTNYHVVQGAAAAQVTLPQDNSTYDATAVGGFPDKDIAVLFIKAPKSKLKPIRIGRSNNLQVGQKAFAIGNPFGLDQTLTTGIVSALDREIASVNGRPIKGVIQTNAAINPGNSGGPLLDSDGLLIGMTTAILSPSGASAGIGFATPVDDINQAVTEIIKHGKVTRPGIGIHIASDQLAQQLARKLGFKSGVVIMDVVKDGPAAKAGIQPPSQDAEGAHVDVIVALDDQPVKNSKDLYSLMEKHKVGDTVKVTLERDGERRDVQITLEALQ
jgi:S1-C subfamily serine protease